MSWWCGLDRAAFAAAVAAHDAVRVNKAEHAPPGPKWHQHRPTTKQARKNRAKE
jgi:hypothetical protein